MLLLPNKTKTKIEEWLKENCDENYCVKSKQASKMSVNEWMLEGNDCSISECEITQARSSTGFPGKKQNKTPTVYSLMMITDFISCQRMIQICHHHCHWASSRAVEKCGKRLNKHFLFLFPLSVAFYATASSSSRLRWVRRSSRHSNPRSVLMHSFQYVIGQTSVFKSLP